jgi:prevent-host-death family protein
MEIVNIHEAKTNLSRLLGKVSQGGSFIIARAGKPVARVTSIRDPDPGPVSRLGFLRGQIRVPDDFDHMGKDEILSMFGDKNASAS